jgi:hypothetical protein
MLSPAPTRLRMGTTGAPNLVVPLSEIRMAPEAPSETTRIAHFFPRTFSTASSRICLSSSTSRPATSWNSFRLALIKYAFSLVASISGGPWVSNTNFASRSKAFRAFLLEEFSEILPACPSGRVDDPCLSPQLRDRPGHIEERDRLGKGKRLRSSGVANVPRLVRLLTAFSAGRPSFFRDYHRPRTTGSSARAGEPARACLFPHRARRG